MSEVEEVQEQMKADMEAIKDQMATMMEAMLSMKKIMKSNVAVVSTTSATAKVDPPHPSGINQTSHLVPDMVGQGGDPRRNFLERKPAEFTPIPIPYVDLLPSLVSNQMVMVHPGKVYQPPFPRGTIPMLPAPIMVVCQGTLLSSV